jgi:uncharacterized protein YndB with AHSA1/START domain
MFTIQQSVTIARPVDRVFAFLTNLDNIPSWRPDVLELRSGGGPLHVGSEFDEVISFGGRKAQRFRVEVLEPNETLEVAAVAGLGIRPRQRHDLSNRDGRTTVSIRVTVRPQGLFRLLEPLLPQMIAAKWRNYGARLTQLLENQPVVPSNETRGARSEDSETRPPDSRSIGVV